MPQEVEIAETRTMPRPDSASALNGFRRFMHWRRQQPALRWGDIRFLDVPEPVLAFTRTLDGEAVLAAFNLSGAPVTLDVSALGALTVLEGHGLVQGSLDGGMLQLPPHAVMYAALG